MSRSTNRVYAALRQTPPLAGRRSSAVRNAIFRNLSGYPDRSSGSPYRLGMCTNYRKNSFIPAKWRTPVAALSPANSRTHATHGTRTHARFCMCSPNALRRSVTTSTAKREHEGNMQSNNNFNILNNINFHTSSTSCYWWSRWKPPTPTATASGWPAAPARAATSGAAARSMPACAALHRLHTSSLCLQHSMQASVWSSTARSTRAVSQADACDQPAPSRSHCPCLAHRCGLCDGLLHLYACLWYVMSHAYLAIAVVCLFVVCHVTCTCTCHMDTTLG